MSQNHTHTNGMSPIQNTMNPFTRQLLEYMTGGMTDPACRTMEKVLLRDPCEEEAAIRIIQIKLQMNDRTSAVKIYRRYAKSLADEFGILPPDRLQKLLNP